MNNKDINISNNNEYRKLINDKIIKNKFYYDNRIILYGVFGILPIAGLLFSKNKLLVINKIIIPIGLTINAVILRIYYEINRENKILANILNIN